MTEPNDRELEQYLAGDSKLSRRYREAGGEGAPPELDEAILAQARAELKRKPPSLNRMLAPFALAASVLLGVNLAWNLWQVEPVPADTQTAQRPQSRDDAFVPSRSPPPPVAKAEPAAPAEAPAAAAPLPERKLRAAPAPEDSAAELDAMHEREAQVAQQREQEELSKRQTAPAMSARRAEAAPSQSFAESAGGVAAAPQAMADAAAPPLSEAQKIDHLIGYVGALQGAVFIRNGKDYGPAEAAKHLQLKREKAGDRVRSADDFIRLCASHSSVSGDAYLIRFTDGRTRTAEDVLREELATLR